MPTSPGEGPRQLNTIPGSGRNGALVIGARTQRQGTGPYIAAGLAAAGLPVTGIVGTGDSSVAEAAQALSDQHGITARGYTDLAQALAELAPLAVAICSPWRFHQAQLEAVAAAGCHCLVEKPLAWPLDHGCAAALVSKFAQRHLLLQVVNQWPTTLAAFRAIYGAVSYTHLTLPTTPY